MRRARCLLVGGALLLCAAHLSSTWADEEGDRSRIQKLTNQITAAQAKGDASAIEALLADDYMAIHSDGSTANKVQEIALFRSGDLRNTRIWVRNHGDWKCVLFQVARFAAKSES